MFAKCTKRFSAARTEFSHVQLSDLKHVGTLGVGGFGRVELVQYKNKVSFALKSLKKVEMLLQQQQEHAYNEKEILFVCESPFIVRFVMKFNFYFIAPFSKRRLNDSVHHRSLFISKF